MVIRHRGRGILARAGESWTVDGRGRGRTESGRSVAVFREIVADRASNRRTYRVGDTTIEAPAES